MTHAIDRTGDWRARLFLEGFDLFNRGKRFEAHEEWEAMWLEEPKGHPNRLFLQGLIQIAAAFHRIETSFPRAAWRLFRSARRKLIPYRSGYKGVDVGALIPLLDGWLERLAVSDGRGAPPDAWFRMEVSGRGWNEPAREADGTAAGQAVARAFEQYSSDRTVRTGCPTCGAELEVNGRSRAPEHDTETAWRVACPAGCVEATIAEGAAR
ncbi:MAG: DUF309 domain-containing protein [Candidatus Brocadiae bacterium]|nr:DUF309 domain-containing protein [Candidatus Brocadiia bacterium]